MCLNGKKYFTSLDSKSARKTFTNLYGLTQQARDTNRVARDQARQGRSNARKGSKEGDNFFGR